MTEVAREPRKDSHAAWVYQGILPLPHGHFPRVYEATFRGLKVLSDLPTTESPRRNMCPHWHVTVSAGPGRKVTDEEMALVRHDFDMVEAEEDNHVRLHQKVDGFTPSIRSLWLPVPPEERGECPCQDDNDQGLIENAGSAIELSGGQSA